MPRRTRRENENLDESGSGPSQRKKIRQVSDSSSDEEEDLDRTAQRSQITQNSTANDELRSDSGEGSNSESEAAAEDVPENIEEMEVEIRNDIVHNMRSGKVLKIQLKNFMCHKNLIVDFNRRANLLVGNNGSGKSAVLAALTIGLGSKANQTNRSSSLKQLIKHGEQSAQIEIHLENDSYDSYERDVYGDKIIVIRDIKTTGQSMYKLKNAKGTVVSTKRDDLLKMALCLNIQVDNPVCVLNQDLARSFLKDSDPKKQYQLFLKATQIDAITTKLNDCTPEYESAKYRLECEERSIKIMEKEIDLLQEKFKGLQSIEKLKGEMQVIRNKLGWKKVAKKEVKKEEIEKELMLKVKEMEENMHIIQHKDDFTKDINDGIEGHRQAIEAKKASTADQKTKYNEVRSIVQKLTEDVADRKRDLKKTVERRHRQQNDVKQIQTDLQQRDETGNRIQAEKRRNEEETADLETKKKEMTVIMENAKRDVDQIQNNSSKLADDREAAKNIKVAKMHEVTRLDNQIKALESSSRDNLAIYGQEMPRILQRIQQMFQKKQFDQMPRGPLGQYVKVVDKKYTHVVESILGNVITAFLVSSDNDRVALNRLFDREFPKVRRSIITQRFMTQKYNIHGGMVQEMNGTHSLINLIKIEDNVVFNCFVDQAKIETILICDEQEVAMSFTNAQENVPANLQKIICLKPMAEFYPKPHYRSYAMQEKQARFLQVNIKEYLQQLHNRKAEVVEQLEEAEHILKKEDGRYEECQSALKNKRRQMNSLFEQLQKINNRIRELKQVEYPAQLEEDALRKEIEELQSTIAATMEQEATIQQEMDDISSELAQKEGLANELRTALNSVESEIQKINDKIDALRTKLHEFNTNARTREQQVARIKVELNELQSVRNNLKVELTGLVQAASNNGIRVETRDNEEKLTHSIASIEKKMRRINAANDQIEDVKINLDLKMQTHATKEKFNNLLKQVLTELYNSRSARYNYLYKLKTHMSLRVKHRFNGVMQLRNYQGEIDIDQKKGTLELSIIPRDKDMDNAVHNTKSLSGGERSYSTVAFLIALWSCVDTPFYFLDEYDVFTDQVNRFTMTQLLLNEAERKGDRQFTFLTPQDMSNIQARDNLTIHRMEDPHRQSQTA